MRFTRLGLPFTSGEGTLTVTPPTYRFDLQIEEDLIEEVVRVIGYDHLPTTPPLAPITAKIRAEAQRSPFAVRRTIAALGYQETINFSFVEERWEHELAGNANPIRLLNPIASQMSVMRSSLLGSLLGVLRLNLARKATRVRVFEAGCVFLRDASVGLRRSERGRCRAADAARWAGLRQRRCRAMGQQGARCRLLRPQGRHRSAAGPARGALRAGRASGDAPGPLRAGRTRRRGHRLCRRVAPEMAASLRAAGRAACCSSSTRPR